jgi:hypothetical protein
MGWPLLAMRPSTGCAAMRFGSLIVATYSASVSAGAANSAKRARRSPAFGPVHPPSCMSQRGIVKWTSVTSGFSPRARQPSTIRR